MSCEVSVVHRTATNELRATFGGPVRTPGDDGYDAARATWAGDLEQRPAIVAEALDARDMRAAVIAACTHDIPLAVQGAGHGTYVPSDGLLLKTGRVDRVQIDVERRIARVDAGASWGQVIAAAAPFGLVPPSGTHASVGVAGYTLGGGVGWLSRKHGFAADNLALVELVTAEGRAIAVSAEQAPELFWALRGAGRNFGVVTALEIRLAPCPTFYAGSAVFPLERAGELLAAFRDLAPRDPRELTTTVVLSRRSGPEPVVGLRSVYLGEADAGERALRRLLDAGGSPLSAAFGQVRYSETEALGTTPPHRFELFAELPDPLIAAAVERVADPDSGVVEIELRHWGGETARTDGTGPVGHRAVPFSMTIAGSPAAAGPLAAYATGGSFLNFLQDATLTQHAYTPSDFARLRGLKRRYDPGNVFGRTHNIAPA